MRRVLLHVAAPADLLHQENAVGAERPCDPRQHLGRSRLVVDGVERQDQVVAPIQHLTTIFAANSAICARTKRPRYSLVLLHGKSMEPRYPGRKTAPSSASVTRR